MRSTGKSNTSREAIPPSRSSAPLKYILVGFALALFLSSSSFSGATLPSKANGFSRSQFMRRPDGRLRRSVRAGIEKKYFYVRSVPPHVSRFNYPWRMYKRLHLPSVKESKGRVLYTPVREYSNAGLGHGMTTVNSELLTALRLRLTYTHRVANYGSLTEQEPQCSGTREKAATTHAFASYSYPGSVEDFFGWGVKEIPREAVQLQTCPSQKLKVDKYKCPICDMDDVKRRNAEYYANPNVRRLSKPLFTVDRIIHVPDNLSYHYPRAGSYQLDQARDRFIRRHAKPNTVFYMPVSKCKRNPAYNCFQYESRAFFFNKYWDAHGSEACRRKPVPDIHHRNEEICRKNYTSYQNYKQRITSSDTIPPGPKRPRLTRMKEHELNVAIHARRGDFFFWNRKMVPTKSFARVARQFIAMIASSGEPFASMPVAVSIYSEGQTAAVQKNDEHDIGHDISKMNKIFIDADGTPNSLDYVTKLIRDNSNDTFTLFKNGLRVSLRISDNTLLSLHEMIAADVFIGSDSSMSTSIVGSLGRAPFFALPSKEECSNHTQIKFDLASGDVSKSEMKKAKTMWLKYAHANKASTEKAIKDRGTSEQA